jgi:uncharacterized protein YdbL (DUF1318 family)
MNINQKNGKNGRIMKSTHWSTRVLTALMVSLLTVSVAIAGSKLTQPKADGLIGEQANGYLGLVAQNAPADIRKLVEATNAKRKAGYQKISAKQGAKLSDVEKVGGNTAIEKTLRGNYLRDASGTWYKK